MAPINADGGVILTSEKFNELHTRYKELKQSSPDGAEPRKLIPISLWPMF